MEVTQSLDHVTHAVIGGSKSIDFGISDSAEFFQVLSQSLYTDPELAMIREVMCNAWDAHIDSGQTNTPIQITLDGQNLTVRDYGFGIPHDDIGPIYGVYGNSTKKADGKQTGGFGLGCKAPFAYTDHFEVTSYNNGTKTIYNMSNSNAQAQGKPGIIRLFSLPTTEHGLLVKIPIRSEDYNRFSKLIHRIASNGEMLVKLNGGELPFIPFSKLPHNYYMTTEKVMGNNLNDSILLRYGNVIYPLRSAKEIEDLYNKVIAFLGQFSDYGARYLLVLQAPPDSISVTPSREALSMQEYTIKTLKKLLKDFLHHAKGLNDEVLVQGKKLIDVAVADKDYAAIFSQGWGFSSKADTGRDGSITTLEEMAQHQLQRAYPGTVKFRMSDVNYRVQKAMETKMVDPHLAATFLKDMPKIQNLPSKYSPASREDRTNWLHRRVLGKAMVKLRDAGLDDTGLCLMDQMDPAKMYHTEKLIPARKSHRRNHLINLPFLRKVIVVTTAVTKLQDRLNYYRNKNPTTPYDGMLCYYVKSRKAGTPEAAVTLFIKLGYEVIDLTKSQPWEKVEAPKTPKKREAYAGLPALSSIVNANNIVRVQNYRVDCAIKLAAPEFVLIISARTIASDSIDGFSALATRAIIKLYGSRVGVAADKNEYNRAIKHGAKDFLLAMEEELQLVLLNSPTVAEYFAYDGYRVRQGVQAWVVNKPALTLVYQINELRKEFGLKKNLTEEEQAMVNILHYSTGLSDGCHDAINTYIETIPLAPENEVVIAVTTGNELVAVLNIDKIKEGLKANKRQIYLDILIKALKG